MTAAWKAALEDARQPLVEAQRVWDSHWHRWWNRARSNGHSPNAAVPIAWTRTEDQYGKRPEPKENKP